MSSVYEIGPFRLDPTAGVLTHMGLPMALGARAVAVLTALVKQPNEFIPKETILDTAWPGVVVEESNLAVQISSIRRVLARAPGGEHWVETLARRGYRFVGPVSEVYDSLPNVTSCEQDNSNLPEPLTSFIGRERELVEIKRLLPGTRLLTLIGVGGIGKTRLALQVAGEVVAAYRDGVWLVDLAPLADPALVPSAVAQVLGVREAVAKPLIETLCSQIKGRELLLVLDNCEHLLNGSAKVADALLRQCPDVQVLATSREALGIGGEQVYRVPALSLPDPKQVHSRVTVAQFEAVQLFTQRAVLARADFQVTDQNASTLASVCYRLDGIPLAIELAATRVRSLSVEEIDAKLDQRFRLLTGGSRTALPRHQTLRSLIDWSYDLLHEPEKRLLQRLSVFAGGWTLESAEQVCTGDGVEGLQVLDLLTSLSDKSLVVAQQKDEHSRYRLLETVRQYARERLVESGGGEATRKRHRDYFLALAEQADSKLMGAEQADWLERLGEEHDNLRFALEWSVVDAGSVGGLRLCGALERFWGTRGHLSEGREWCARVLGKAGSEERTQEYAKALNTAGILAWRQADYPAARARQEESLAIAQELGDQRAMVASLNNLGNVDRDQGEVASARSRHEQCLAIMRELGDQWGIARSLNNLGNVALDQSDYSAAWALYEESLAIRRELGFPGGIASALHNLASVANLQGDYAAARALYEECLVILRKLGDRWGIALSLEGLATVLATLGSCLRAARIWSAAESLREEIGSPLPPHDRLVIDRHVAAARAALVDDAAFDRGWQEGRALTLEQAIELALEKTIERA